MKRLACLFLLALLSAAPASAQVVDQGQPADAAKAWPVSNDALTDVHDAVNQAVRTLVLGQVTTTTFGTSVGAGWTPSGVNDSRTLILGSTSYGAATIFLTNTGSFVGTIKVAGNSGGTDSLIQAMNLTDGTGPTSTLDFNKLYAVNVGGMADISIYATAYTSGSLTYEFGAGPGAVDMPIGTQAISAVALPLPNGASTAARQDSLLTELQLKADLTETQPVSLASIPINAAAATAANQTTGNGSLASIKTNTDPLVASGGGGYVRQDSTATIAKETGGNLATVKTNTDPLVAAGAGGYVRQDSTATIAKETGGNLATIKTNTDPFVVSNFGGYVRQDSTASIAKETGGNLASIKTDVDKIPSQGQALANASTPVVLTAIQVAALTPPTFVDGGAGFAQESSNVGMAGFVVDDAAGTALAENDVAAARITTSRALVTRFEGTTRGIYGTITTIGGVTNALDVNCASGCAAAATSNHFALSVSESVAAPTAATWYLKRKWNVPLNAVFVPTRAAAAVTTAGSRTLIGVAQDLGHFNVSSNSFTDFGSVASPRFYARLFACVDVVMSAVANTVTVTYTDDGGAGPNSTTALSIPASAPEGNCFEFQLAATLGQMRDGGVIDITAVSDTAAPTGTLILYGVNPLLDTQGVANALEATNSDIGQAVDNTETVLIMFNQAATTAQQRTATLVGTIR